MHSGEHCGDRMEGRRRGRACDHEGAGTQRVRRSCERGRGVRCAHDGVVPYLSARAVFHRLQRCRERVGASRVTVSAEDQPALLLPGQTGT